MAAAHPPLVVLALSALLDRHIAQPRSSYIRQEKPAKAWLPVTTASHSFNRILHETAAPLVAVLRKTHGYKFNPASGMQHAAYSGRPRPVLCRYSCETCF